MQDKTSQKTVETADEFLIPEIDPDDLLDNMNLGEVIPTMNVPPAPMQSDNECIVEDGILLGLYDEIIVNCRNDREKVDEIQTKFEDMVVNDGDATSASKEALVNLMKIKTDINDKMAKVADLMTRIKLRENNTFKPYLAVAGKTSPGDNKKQILSALKEHERRKESNG
jgi:hypothetical protein